MKQLSRFHNIGKKIFLSNNHIKSHQQPLDEFSRDLAYKVNTSDIFGFFSI